MNIANWASAGKNYTTPRGIGTIAYFAPISLSIVQPTNRNNLIGKVTIDSTPTYIVKIGSPTDGTAPVDVLNYLFAYQPCITYRPHKDLSSETTANTVTANYMLTGIKWAYEATPVHYLFFNTNENVVKYIERWDVGNNRRSFVGANTPNLQQGDDVTQYQYTFNTSIRQQAALYISATKQFLFDSLYASSDKSGTVYANFYTGGDDAARGKQLTASTSWNIGTETRCFTPNIFHPQDTIETYAIDVLTKKNFGSFYAFINPFEFTGKMQFIFSDPIPSGTTIIEYAARAYAYTAAYSSLLTQSSSTPLICGKMKLLSGYIYTRSSATHAGNVFYLLDNDSTALFPMHTVHFILVCSIPYRIYTSVTATIVVEYTDGTQEEKTIAIATGGSSSPVPQVPVNLFLVENGQKLKSVPYSSVQFTEFDPASTEPFVSGTTQYFPDGTYLFQNASNKTIRKLFVYATSVEATTPALFLVLSPKT